MWDGWSWSSVGDFSKTNSYHYDSAVTVGDHTEEAEGWYNISYGQNSLKNWVKAESYVCGTPYLGLTFGRSNEHLTSYGDIYFADRYKKYTNAIC